MEQLEAEVKFFLPGLDLIRRRILDLGAQSRGRCFEDNVRFEDAGCSLRDKRSLLRLRRDQNVKLTFKAPLPKENDQFKVLRELEVEVSDFDTMHRMLEALGFHREQVYQKRREILVLKGTHFCLDSMPYGDFIEIEGPPPDIKKFAERLNLPWNQRILLNYLEIFQILQVKLKLDFSDVTFANFDGIKVNLAEYLDVLVAGNG